MDMAVLPLRRLSLYHLLLLYLITLAHIMRTVAYLGWCCSLALIHLLHHVVHNTQLTFFKTRKEETWKKKDRPGS